MSPYEAMTWPCRASATPSSTSGMSVTQTGHPGPMMTFRSFGKVARRPNFAIACSWLPQTCMTETGDRPISFVTRAIVSTSRRATVGSRNFSCIIAAVSRSLSIAAARPFDLPPHVRRHEVVAAGFPHERLVEGERFADVFLGNSADREADVVQDVIARRNRLVHDVEAHFAAHAPEIHDRDSPTDRHDLARNSEAHHRPPDFERADATTA